MFSMNQTQYLSQLRRQLIDAYDEVSLQALCLRLGVNYNDLSGNNRSDKARELVLYLHRRRRLSDLEQELNGL